MLTTPTVAGSKGWRIQFGHGHVEVRAQPVFQAAHHLPLVFEGLRGFDVQFEGEKSDHCSRQSSVVSRQLILKTDDRRLTTALRDCFGRDFLGHEGFDYVADLDVAVVGDRDAALHAVA